MFENTDEALFSRIIQYETTSMCYSVTCQNVTKYSITSRPRQHSRQLISKATELNIITVTILCRCCVKMPIDVYLYNISMDVTVKSMSVCTDSNALS